VLKTRGFAIALAAVVSLGSKYLFRLIAASRERRPIFPFLQLSAFRHNGHDFSEDEFRSQCRFGFSNKRRLLTIGFRGRCLYPSIYRIRVAGESDEAREGWFPH